MTLTPKPGVLDIAPYVGGRAPCGRRGRRLSNCRPTNPRWGRARRPSRPIEAAAEHLSTSIPKAARKILREAIGEAYGLDPGRIVCGNGSDELLTMLANAYLRPGDEVLFSEHAFLVYRIATLANSAMPVVVPEKNLRVDVDAMLRARHAQDAARLSRQSEQSDGHLSDAATKCAACMPACRLDTLLVIDAAYAEYVRRNDYEAGIEMVSQFHNVVMTRTFSKIYGLAGLRVGWAFCPGRASPMCSIAFAGRSMCRLPAQRAGGGGAREIARMSKRPSRITRNGAPG